MIDRSELLSLGDFLGPMGAVFVLIGFIAFLVAAIRPLLFYPLLIWSAIVGLGPKILGYALLDELVATSLVLGFFWGRVVFSDSHNKNWKRRGASRWFLFWTVWLLAETFRALISTGDYRLIRWIILFGTLIAIAFVIQYGKLPALTNVSLFRVVLSATVVNLCLYIIAGFWFDYQLGFGGRYHAQGLYWSGSAAAVFPMILSTPVALIGLRTRKIDIRLLSIVVIVQTIMVALFYDSRFAWLILISYVLFNLRRINFLHLGMMTLLVFLFFGWFVGNWKDKSVQYFSTLVETVNVADPQPADLGRFIELRAAYLLITDHPAIAVVGAGMYGHRPIMATYAVPLWEDIMPYDYVTNSLTDYKGQPFKPNYSSTYRTTGLAAFSIDTGIVGMLLLLAAAVARWRFVRRNSASTEKLWRLILPWCLLSMFIFNMIDIILFYLILMSGGVVDMFLTGHANVDKSIPS